VDVSAQSFASPIMSALHHSKLVKPKLESVTSRDISSSEDSFAAQVDAEQERRDKYLEDSDEDDFLVPKAVKQKMLEKCQKENEIKHTPFIKMNEEIHRNRWEVVKRINNVKDPQVTESDWNDMNASKVSRLIK